MKFDIEYIEKVAKIITDNGLTEISMEDGEQAITIRKDLPEVITTNVPVASPVAQTPIVSASSAEQTKSEEKKGNPIVSPMVGTFYSKPSPDAEPFVKIGDIVSVGDTVCIVEAMKMMNEIESEFSGKIVEVCVKDGDPVEYGQVIMYVE